MLLSLIATRQKLFVYVRGLAMAIHNHSLRAEDIQVGEKGLHRTAQETQDYLRNSSKGKTLGISHLL